jgi:hypothetical protein
VNEKDLLGLWASARLHIMVAQFAPTFLLAVTVTALALNGGEGGPIAVKLASAGVLLASGLLGAIAQYTSAAEAQAVATDMRALENPSRVVQQIVATAWWTTIVKFVTPAIFTVIFLAILWQLFIAR